MTDYYLPEPEDFLALVASKRKEHDRELKRLEAQRWHSIKELVGVIMPYIRYAMFNGRNDLILSASLVEQREKDLLQYIYCWEAGHELLLAEIRNIMEQSGYWINSMNRDRLVWGVRKPVL